jgi:hypothetical protein
MPQADIMSFTAQILTLVLAFILGFIWTNTTFFNIYFKTKIIESRFKLLAIYKGFLFKYQLNKINSFVWFQTVLGTK